MHGKLLACKDIEDIRLHDIYLDERYRITKDEVVTLWQWFGSTILDPSQILPVRLSREWVDTLKKYDKQYSLITARNGNDPIKKQGTLAWIEKYFSEILPSKVFFVNHYVDGALPKSEVCKIQWITLMIDDHIANAQDLCEHGIACILLEKSWNRHETFDHPLLYRVQDWQEIIDSLYAK